MSSVSGEPEVVIEQPPEPPGRGVFIASAALAGAWIAAALLAGYRYIGWERFAALDPISIMLLIAVGILPALMVLLAGQAAREGVRARFEAGRLADAANGLLNPAAHSESAARRLAVAVRGEIATLDKALEHTLSRVQEIETSITKQQHSVNHVAAAAKRGADAMISGMEHERAELLRIAEDLNAQAALIGQHISQHTHQIAQAARFAEAEVRAADEALDARLQSFGAAAALITDRTEELTGAAAASSDSALRLETALSSALDALARATQLTDAARQSAEAATMAASSSAGAMRDTAARAIEEAKRAAEMIRGEAASVERDASSALAKLRDAAENARGAARAARDAAAPAPIQPAAPPQPVAPPPAPSRSTFARGPAELRPRAPTAPPQPEPSAFEEPPAPASPHPSAANGNGGAWTWRELLSSMDDDDGAGAPSQPRRSGAGPAPEPPTVSRRRAEAEDPIARLTKSVTEQRGAHPIGAVAVIAQAGVNMGEVFTAAALDRIAHRSRNGTQARRKAVKDAVGPAVARLKEHLKRTDQARLEAANFLRSDGARIAELLSRGRASMSADATRAFLLLDAAEG
ncbi:MAG: hypothetical protein AB7J28_08305 [Hyphomonadaceae bacterium]